MTDPQLLDYVKSQTAGGIDKETIKQNLLSNGGWNGADIDEAFKAITPGAVTAKIATPAILIFGRTISCSSSFTQF